MLAKRFLIITSNSYAHTKTTYKNLLPYKVCKAKLWECGHSGSQIVNQRRQNHDTVNSRFANALPRVTIIRSKSCRCLTEKNLVILSRNLDLTELRFLLLVVANGKIFYRYYGHQGAPRVCACSNVACEQAVHLEDIVKIGRARGT